jgi:hypothetical protein
MRKVFYLAVALLTFAIGATLFYLTKLRTVSVAVPKPAEVRIEQKPEVKLPPAGPDNVSIVLRTNLDDEATPEFKYRTLKLFDKPVIVDDLGVPEYVDDQEIKILGGDGSSKFRVSERYRTSMTVMGEGPHLDLVDWSHFDSEWIPLQQIAQRKFRTLKRERMDAEKFPATTQAEILAAVRRRAGDWPEAIELAKQCSGPKEYPCSVGVSSVYFQIEMLVGDQWATVGVVEVQIPMGC